MLVWHVVWGFDVTDTESGETDSTEAVSSTLWEEIGDDVEALFGDDVAVTVRNHETHLDVRIVPNRAVEKLEAEYEDLKIVPYNACQMTIRKEDMDDDEGDT